MDKVTITLGNEAMKTEEETMAKQVKKTGRIINVFGERLAEVSEFLNDHDVVQVEGQAYYTHDFGGVIVGSRTATSVDFGDNDTGRGTRTAPTSTQGMAAPMRRGTLPTRIQYGPAEICENQND